jgi:hypothetical protein
MPTALAAGCRRAAAHRAASPCGPRSGPAAMCSAPELGQDAHCIDRARIAAKPNDSMLRLAGLGHRARARRHDPTNATPRRATSCARLRAGRAWPFIGAGANDTPSLAATTHAVCVGHPWVGSASLSVSWLGAEPQRRDAGSARRRRRAAARGVHAAFRPACQPAVGTRIAGTARAACACRPGFRLQLQVARSVRSASLAAGRWAGFSPSK